MLASAQRRASLGSASRKLYRLGNILVVLLHVINKTLPPRKDEGSVLVVPPCFDNQSAQPVWINCPYSSSNGLSRNALLVIHIYCFRHSTSESRSRVVSEGGSHPVTSTL